jgi:hypothetical protein
MQRKGEGRSRNKVAEGSRTWMPTKNGKNASQTWETMDKPIPKPTTDLGFTGISHKTSGHSLSNSLPRIG